ALPPPLEPAPRVCRADPPHGGIGTNGTGEREDCGQSHGCDDATQLSLFTKHSISLLRGTRQGLHDLGRPADTALPVRRGGKIPALHEEISPPAPDGIYV